MAKFLIAFAGRPLVQGFKIGEFKWDEARRLYVFLGREIEAHEFNAQMTHVYRTAANLPFRVTLVDEVPAVAAIAPVATITTATAHEITLEEAEATIQRLAPHRLKKKTGRPNSIQPAAAAA